MSSSLLQDIGFHLCKNIQIGWIRWMSQMEKKGGRIFTAEQVKPTFQDAVNALNHELCILHAEAHGRFKFNNTLPRAICTDTDFILF